MLDRERETGRERVCERERKKACTRLAGGDQIIQTHLDEFFNDFSVSKRTILVSIVSSWSVRPTTNNYFYSKSQFGTLQAGNQWPMT